MPFMIDNASKFKGKTIPEISEIAGLNWEAHKVPSTYEWQGETRNHHGRFSVVRGDKGTPIGSVGSKFDILQNSEIFEIISTLREFSDLEIVNAGTFGDGKKVFVITTFGDEFKLTKKDGVMPYLFFGSAFDGSAKFTMTSISYRHICENLFRMIVAKTENNEEDSHSISHTAAMRSRIAQAKNALLRCSKGWQEYTEEVSKFAEIKANDEMLLSISNKVFGDVKEDSKKGTTRRANMNGRILEIFHSETGAGASGLNLWTAANAVTQYLDHEHQIKLVRADGSKLDESEARFETNLWGSSAIKKDKVFSVARQMAFA